MGLTDFHSTNNSALNAIVQLLNGIGGGGGGLATEVTLQAVLTVLTDLFSEQRIDFELKCIEDDNGDTFLLRVRWDENAPGGYSIDYIDATGAVATPVAPLKLCSPNEILANIEALLTSIDGKDFATETTLAAIQALLTSIDGTDFATETTLANFLTAFNNEDFATETTLLALSAKFNSLGQKLSAASAPVVLSTEQEAILTAIDTVLDAIKLDTASLVTNTGDIATETTLTAVEALLTTIDTVLDNIKLDTANLDVALSTLATEATLSAIETLLTSLNSTDFATETTLAALNAKLNSLGQKASADSAPVVLSTEQEVILSAIRTAVENIDMDTNGLATEVTLAALLSAFNAEDFATETTLASLASTDFATQTTLNDLLTAFNAEDFATQTTLQALLTAFNGEDFATQTTLNALLTAFNSEDFASETTLAALNNQYTGGVVVTRVDISGNAAYAIPAGTYSSIQLIVSTGTVSDGTITYPVGVFSETAPLNKTLSAVTLDATGATAYVKLMA